ncbi:carboxymuconolactone decarboxylase family protein [Nocardioides albus]|uniref:AhpD family alkylhydroperoxidase n=1 Tax=Nocardioides albus TaxID=1841 RepID=A0A7W5FA53_9ACTN|nr:carboxymuconolactone decarboxylase family protein [Nocardioides albus]MBB3090850.1 AhpD family alkylhydroperoxidase [Nocardioides albus]GGU37907.1 alkyl hydroperoxide reductase AhpD [Nocardioides albus]
MPRIPVHTLDSAPEESQVELKALRAQFGKVLNIFGEMAHAPIVLQSYVALQQVFDDYGTFDARTREAIALAVGNADECAYCQAAHTAGGKAAGLTGDQTIAIRRGTVDFDAKLAALLALAREYTLNVGHVQDATWQAALDAGWADEQLTELSAHVTVNLFTNYFNHFVDTEVDLPAAPVL